MGKQLLGQSEDAFSDALKQREGEALAEPNSSASREMGKSSRKGWAHQRFALPSFLSINLSGWRGYCRAKNDCQ
jgi:hypothetical protein